MYTRRTVREVLNSIWVTGPDGTNTYWLHVDSGNLKSSLNLGVVYSHGPFLEAFEEFDRQRKQALGEA